MFSVRHEGVRVPQVAKLLEEDEADLTRTAAQILVHAGRLIAVGTPRLAGELASRMEGLCRVGDMKTAKAAVRQVTPYGSS